MSYMSDLAIQLESMGIDPEDVKVNTVHLYQ
jgi:hypothetical protein